MIQTLPLNANVMQDFIGLFSNVGNINWKMILMWIIGAVLVYLAIKKEMEPTLLLPMGFGTILVNLPLSGAIGSDGPLTVLFKAGIANELFPLLLFIGIGAMIDFGPLLKNPWLMLSVQLHSLVFSSHILLQAFSLMLMTLLLSLSSVPLTDRLQSSLPTNLAQNISVRLWLPHIHIWLLFRLFSHLLSRLLQQKKSV